MRRTWSDRLFDRPAWLLVSILNPVCEFRDRHRT